MSRKKNNALDILLGGVLEAERNQLDEDDIEKQEYDDYLKSLLTEFLTKDDDPFRAKLYHDYMNGKPLTGEDGIRKKLGAFDMEFLEEPTFPTTL